MLRNRNMSAKILESADDTPVVMLIGARQTGKSTLMQNLYDPSEQPAYFTMDDLSVLAAATVAPQHFIEQLPNRVIIDEIQRAPGLLLPIKHSVDKDRRPGRFFLTGSAQVLGLPMVADSLAGRMDVHTLAPFSQGELRGQTDGFADAVFSDEKLPHVAPIRYEELLQIICTGGYPDIVSRESPSQRQRWFRSYVKTLLERDVRDLRHVEQLTVFPRLLTLLATRAGSLLNNSDLSRSLEMPVATLRSYLSLLQSIFLIVPLRPWFGNIGKRLVKSPKIYINDTGLLCHLLGLDAMGLKRGPQLLGPIYENFVVMECLKQLSWSDAHLEPFHFRTEGGAEVDLVLERTDGKLVGIECKLSGQIGPDAFNGLAQLKSMTGSRFHRGVVLYSGSETLSFGQDLHAMPVSALWEL